MTDKELIQAMRCCGSGDCCNCPAEPSDSRCVHEVSWGAVADRLEALLTENKHLREAAKMMPEWVSVEERLPEVNSTVLVYRPGMERKILLVRYGKFWEDGDVKYTEFGFENGAITHWMPLPSTEGVE